MCPTLAFLLQAFCQLHQYQLGLANHPFAVIVQGTRQVEIGHVQLMQGTLAGEPDLPGRQQCQRQAYEHQQDEGEAGIAFHKARALPCD